MSISTQYTSLVGHNLVRRCEPSQNYTSPSEHKTQVGLRVDLNFMDLDVDWKEAARIVNEEAGEAEGEDDNTDVE